MSFFTKNNLLLSASTAEELALEDPILDIYPNATAAFSLRKLRTDYTGPIINLIRTSNSNNQDFYANDKGFLNWNEIADWVGYNLWSYSEDLTQSAWTKTRTSISPDLFELAPDSSSNALVLLETSTTGAHSLSRGSFGLNNIFTRGNKYTISFWVKSYGRNFINIQSVPSLGFNNVAPSAFINLIDGSIVSQNEGFINANLQVLPEPNGWFKVSYTLTHNSISDFSNTLAFVINLSTNGSTISYLGDASLGISIWGLQISETSTVKPYQKTLAVAGGVGRMRIWYDQSGNNRTATNTNTSTQFLVVNRSKPLGNINPTLNKPPIRFQSTGSYVLSPSFSTGSTHSLMIGVYRWQGSNFSLFGNSATGGSPLVIGHSVVSGVNTLTYRFTNSSVDNSTVSNCPTGTMITSTNKNGNLREVWNNNILLNENNNALSGASTSTTRLGSINSSASPSAGDWFEMIYWSTNQTAFREDITDRINNYYKIY
jgi:hypothetical protein